MLWSETSFPMSVLWWSCTTHLSSPSLYRILCYQWQVLSRHQGDVGEQRWLFICLNFLYVACHWVAL